MPRKPRIKADGLLHHVVHRGINRQAIFADDEDRRTFLRILAYGLEKNGVKLLCYCLMTNHHHLLIEDTSAAISELMHYVNAIYTKSFNNRHQCEGALLRGRFYSSPVYDARYELVLFRYIHLNPVHANIVQSSARYAWSSYRSYLSGDSSALLSKDRLMRRLAAIGIKRQNLHAWMDTLAPALDAECKPEEIGRWLKGLCSPQRQNPHRGDLLNSPLIRGQMAAVDASNLTLTPADARERRLVQECMAVAQSYGVALGELVGPSRRDQCLAFRARGVAMLRCRTFHQCSDSELSRLFCLSKQSIGVTLTRARALAGREGDPLSNC